MSSRPTSPSFAAELSDPTYAVVRAPLDPEEDQDRDDDTDSTDTWCSRGSRSSSAGGHELAEAVQGSATLPSIGEIAVESSSEVYIGSNTHFHGAVTLYVPQGTLPSLLPAASVRHERPSLRQDDEKDDQHASGRHSPLEAAAKTHDDPPTKNCWIKKMRASIVVPVFGLAVVSCIIMVVFQMQRSHSASKNDTSKSTFVPTLVTLSTAASLPTNQTTESSTTTTPEPSPTEPPLNVVSREEWGASPPSGKRDPLPIPASWLIVHHTGRASCSTQDKCADLTRDVQSVHMNVCGWYDIGYNFLVGGEGSVLEGRGWKMVGAHTRLWNSESIGVALIGNFNSEPPPTAHQQVALAKLAAMGVRLGYLRQDYRLVGACQLKGTLSPGVVGMRWLRNVTGWCNYTTQNAECTDTPPTHRNTASTCTAA